MNTKQGTPDAAKERIAELEEVKRAYARDIHLLWAECDALRSRNAELVEILSGCLDSQECNGYIGVALAEEARALLAKAPA